MKTTTFCFGILLAAILVVVAWSSPVQGRDSAAGPEGNQPSHPLMGELCENAHTLAGPMPYSMYGGTVGRGDDYDLGDAGGCVAGGVQSEVTGQGEDDVFVFSTDVDCPIAMSLTPEGPHNLALYVVSSDCGDVGANCLWVDDGSGPGGVEELEIMAVGGQYYFVIVDGSGGESGDYSLDLYTSGECIFEERYGKVGDRLWLDDDRDGIQDEGEENLNLGLVNLHTCGGPILQGADLYVDTDYEFAGLLPGEYYIEYLLPAGYEFSPRDQGENDAVDSDADPETGTTACFSVGAETHDMTWDAGAYPETFTLGGRAWYDTDWDGIQDSIEVGLEGVQLLLQTGSCEATSGPTVDSDTTGSYAFEDVAGGTYCIEEFAMPPSPGTWMLSPKDAGGDDAVDSDFDETWRNTGLLSVSADKLDLDLGAYVEGYIGGWVWCDANGNQVQDAGEGVENVRTRLYADPECDTVKNVLLDQYLTESDGWYDYWDLHTGPPGGPPECYVVEVDPADMGACNQPLVSTSKPIAVDALHPSWAAEDFGFREPELAMLGDRVWYDTDADGVQDQGEPGLEGVDLALYLSACGASSPTTTTSDAVGAYTFSNLAPNTYCIEMSDVPSTPGPWYISPPGVGSDDTLDSDFSPITGNTGSIAVSADNPHLDLGMYTIGTISGRVWCDANEDGSFDAGEGMAGAEVDVYKDDDCDTVKNGWKAMHSSGSDGAWLANGLLTGPPGGPAECYVLEVDPDSLGACSDPIGPSGKWFALAADSPLISNVSFGFRMPAGLSLGDRVWYDTDRDGIQDGGEPGVEGIGVELFANGTCQGSPQASDTSGATGFYGFSGLADGTYCLSFAGGIPQPYYLTPPNNGGDDSLDSDVDVGTKRIENVNLSASNLTYDAGLFAFGWIEGRVFCDHDADGSYDLDELVQGITVRLYADTHCDTVRDGLLTTDDTAADGFFDFNPVDVGPPGGPPLCYVLQVELAGLGDCDSPLTSDERSLALTVDNRVSQQNNFGFTDQLPLMRVYVPLALRQ